MHPTSLLPLVLLSGCLTARPPSLETVDRSPERVARGRYLARHVAGCVQCHSPRDWSLYLGPVRPGTAGSGGDALTGNGFPGAVVPPNLSSDVETGVGGFTDGELIRAIREGVSHDGRALFPYMPYPFYRSMADEDVRAVVAYLRTLPAVRRQVPASRLDFPVSLFINFAPKPVTQPVARPDPRDTVAWGRYLGTLALCAECHTPKDDRGRSLKGRELSGGAVYRLPGFTVETPNITPFKGTYVAQASREEFIARFKELEGYDERPRPAEAGRNSTMPWSAFAGMTREDLGAIYDWLRAVPPLPPGR